MLVVVAALALLVGIGGVLDLVLSNSRIAGEQQQAATRIQRDWTAPPRARAEAPLPDDAIGLLRIPAFGSDWVRVIGRGTGSAVLDSGEVGHYTGTAMPGQVGNMVLAAHREADGAAFLHITRLRPGDVVSIETRTRIYRYRVTGGRQIDPDAVDAIAPVPWHPHEAPTRRLITLQSCTPPLIDTWRYVVWAELESSTARA
ncbi:class E sortase [Amnibacterium kyonggiense]